jgi:murein DD-endopeptidase MepM/ murein hydrolase activator NlpD
MTCRLAILLTGAASLLVMASCDAVRIPGVGDPPPDRTPPTDGETIDAPQPDTDPPVSDIAQPDDGVETPPTDVQPPEEEPEAPPDPEPEPEPEVPPEPEPEPVPPVFSYFAPGALLPGTGAGFEDQIVHAPGIRFPIKSAPAYLQTQVFTFGGGVAGGDQCDARNFAYPWRDNFCETRTANRNTPFCPVNRVHQGQDIRVGTPQDCNALRRQPLSARGLHEVVAVEDGVISSIGSYTVKLRSNGRIYNYMHLNMNRLAVTAGQSVREGDLIGFVSNDFGGTPTTIHLHFEIVQNTAEHGWTHVSPYLSLVEAYERRQQGFGERLPAEFGVASVPEWEIPEGFEIIE